MKKPLCFLLLFFLLLPSVQAVAAQELQLGAEEITGFAQNTITLYAPSPGLVRLSVVSPRGLLASWTENVVRGENRILWDGTGWYGEPIPRGKYTLRAELLNENGPCCTGECPLTIAANNNALLFALPKSRILYTGDAAQWSCEMRIAASGGEIVTEFVAADTPDTLLGTKRNRIESGYLITYRWDGRIGGKAAAPGRYLLRFYEKSNPAYVCEAEVEIREGKAPQAEVTVTGSVMPPPGLSDAALWEWMQKPSVVAALPSQTDHLKVRADKGKGQVLGTLHGQSQGVEVLRREGRYAFIGAWNHESGSYMEGWVEAARLRVEEPDPEYGLLVDKNAQTLTVFHRGKRLGTVSISTGLAAENRLIRETAAGSFLTADRVNNFSGEGEVQYDYAIRYDGGNLIHQLGYRKVDGYKDFSQHAAQLGTKASQGCIRVSNQPGEGGINAYWLYSHLPARTRVIVLDDPEQRILQQYAAEGLGELPGYEPVSPPAMEAGQRELVITLGGDTALGIREGWWQREDALPAYLNQHGTDYPLSRLRPIFAQDDLTLLNLECVLKTDAAGEDKSKEYRFRGLPEWTACLTAASVEQVSIANNHYIDYGQRGKEQTRAALDAAGIGYSGFEECFVFEKDGLRIGFAGCRETVYQHDGNVIYRDIRRLRQAGCDVVIYSCHWGKEYAPEHNRLQRQMAAAAVAAGADIVVGTHPHVVQGVAAVGKVPVLWSLGNLMFGGTIDLTTYDGMLAQLRLRYDASGYLGCTVELIPVLTSGRAAEGINDYCPLPAQGEDRLRILTKVQADTPFRLQDRMYFPQ